MRLVMAVALTARVKPSNGFRAATWSVAVLPAGAANWLLRVTPAAAFSVQQGYPRYP